MFRKIVTNLILTLGICICAVQLQAQVMNPDLVPLLRGAGSIDEIVTVVDSFYEARTSEEPEFESEWLKWKRWEWYMSHHLGPNGSFVNVSKRLWAAHEQVRGNLPDQTRNINSSWIFAGPSSSPLGNSDALYNGLGRVDRIEFHPSDASTIFIGAPAGGLWKTTNDGTSWINLTDHLPSIAVSGIVISHANASHIYILTGDGDSNTSSGLIDTLGLIRESIGVLKSTDGGINWERTGDFPDSDVNGGFVGYELVQDPNNASILYAATSAGLYRTGNGGDTWTRERTGLHYDVAFKPSSSSRIYTTVRGGYAYSDNSGNSWQNGSFDISITGNGRVTIGVTPAWSSRVYLLAGPAGTNSFRGLWTSTDSGETFTRQSNSPNVLGQDDDGSDGSDQSDYDLAIAPSSSLSSRVLVAGLTVWRSTDSGENWTKSTSYNEDGSFPYIHPDVHDLEYNPLNNFLYAATDGGVYKSTDNGNTWTDISDNIETTQFYHMRVWNASSVKMMAGCQDNGVKYRPSSTTAWEHIMQADGFDVAFNPLNGEPGYCALNGTTIRFSNDGSSSTVINPVGGFFKTLAVHNTRPDTVLCGAANIQRSYDGGTNWTDEGNSGSWSLASCRSNNSRFYATGGSAYTDISQNFSGAYRSDDNGDTWTTISGNSGFPATWTRISDIAARTNNSSNVWVTFGGFADGQKVYRSFNSGSSWINMSDNLPNVPVYCVVVDDDNGAYVGTDLGVFYRGPSMSEWMLWSNGLPNAPVTDLAIQDTYVRCSTFGRGAYYAFKADACSEAILVTGRLDGWRQYEANLSILSTGDVEGGEGTFVSFKAGDYIDLQEGFDVFAGNEFHGFLGPCGQGGIPEVWQPGANAATRKDGEEGPEITHAFPLGSIDHIDLSGKTVTASITLRQKGNIEFRLAAADLPQEVVYSENLSAGQRDVTIDLSDYERGFYYLTMYNDNRVAHFQEVNLD